MLDPLQNRGKCVSKAGCVLCVLTVCIIVLPCTDNTAAIVVKQGPFSLDDPEVYSVDVRISDGGLPIQFSITKVAIKVCVCFCV